jgi:hypothetical protein
LKPCPFGLGLRKFALDFVVVIFFKNAEKIASGGLILYLEKLGLILYCNFLQNLNSKMKVQIQLSSLPILRWWIAPPQPQQSQLLEVCIINNQNI